MGRNRVVGELVAHSQAMKSALELCRLYARVNRPVVFVGPVGAGKTALARRLYQAADLAGLFVPLSAGELRGTLYADVLFGHVSGAYTDASDSRPGALAEAEGGMLLLDDLRLLSEGAQAAILRVVESGRFRPLGASTDRLAGRVLFATTVAPRRLEAEGKLLPDLASRMGEFLIPVPPLRERCEDIIPIALRAAERFIEQHEMRATPLLSDEVVRILLTYEWPGNVRELEAVIDRAVAHAGVDDGVVHIRRTHLPKRLSDAEITGSSERRRLNRDIVVAALRVTNGNQSAAARLLDVHRNTIGYHLRSSG